MPQLRFIFLLSTAVFAVFLATSTAQAHHGWAWATDEEFEITGVIQSVRLGSPHGEVTIRATQGYSGPTTVVRKAVVTRIAKPTVISVTMDRRSRRVYPARASRGTR